MWLNDERVYSTLNIIDEFTRKALRVRVDRKLNSIDVVDALTDLFILRGPPAFVRSDNPFRQSLCDNLPGSGPRVHCKKKVRARISAVGARTAYITPAA